MENRSLVTIAEHSKEKILYMLEMAKEFEAKPNRHLLDEKVVATLFFEPSTRTRLSFETAANRLGARVIGFSDPKATSSSKGETLKDTIKMVSNYADIIVMRHYLEGAARYASEVTTVPIVNAGDGANQHPSQTMLDLYSIYKTQGTLENLNIYLVGDLKYGRTVHSLIVCMSHFNPTFNFIAPNELRMPDEQKNFCDKHGIKYNEYTEFTEDIINQTDILYMTRVQKERFFNEEDYVLDTIAQYPNDPTLGKLTFMIDLKNQQKDQNVADFNGVGKSKLTMSLGYKDGNYPSESQVPIYTSQDVTAKYAVKLRLKGELLVSGDEWMIDYVYAQLASLFQPYPPANFPEVFMCKGGMKLGTFDSFRRTCTFDITYDRSDLSFSQLYFNLFINLAGQKRENRVRLRIDKESYFELYEQSEEM